MNHREKLRQIMRPLLAVAMALAMTFGQAAMYATPAMAESSAAESAESGGGDILSSVLNWLGFDIPSTLSTTVASTVYYKISGTTLYIRSNSATGYSAFSCSKSTTTWPWESNTTVTKVVIEDKIGIPTGYRFFYGLSNVTAIENISNLDTSNVTNMFYMFRSCHSIRSLDLSGWDVSKVTNFSAMFEACRSITSINMRGWQTASATNMSWMFHATAPSSIDVSMFDTSKVTSMAYMFYDSPALTNLDLSNWDTSSATRMEHMFENCGNLRHLDLSSFDTSKVTNTTNMFSSCSSMQILITPKSGITTIPLPKTMYDAATKYTTMPVGSKTLTDQQMPTIYYKYTDNGATLHLSGTGGTGWTSTSPTDTHPWTNNYRQGSWTTNPTITKIAIDGKIVLPADSTRYFSGLVNVSEIVGLGNIDTSHVTNMNGMFGVCSSLTSLDLSTFDTSHVTDMSSLFEGDEKLASLNMSSFDTSSVRNLAWTFVNCKSLKSLDLSGWDTSRVKDMRCMFYTDTNMSLTSLDLSGWDTSNVTNVTDMFYKCTSLKSLKTQKAGVDNIALPVTMYEKYNIDSPAYTTMPSGALTLVTTKATTDIYYRIDGTTLRLNSSGGSGWTKATTIGKSSGDWKSNTSVTKVVIAEPIHPTSCAYMFYGLNNVAAIENISNIDTSKVTNMFYMFRLCDSLESLDVSGWDVSKVTNFSAMFEACRSITSINMKGWQTTSATNMSWMFHGTALSSIDVSMFDTSKVTSMAYMFYDSPALTNLDLSTFDTSNVTRTDRMFYKCPSLTSLDLSGWDTSSVTDVTDMFRDCTSLKSLDLSGWDTSSVTSASNMLYGCSRLATLTTQKAGVDNIALPATMYEKDNYDSPAHATMPSGALTLVTTKATCGIYYKIDGNTLRLSGTERDGYLGANPNAWQWTNNTDITKVVIEDDITPATCGGLFSNLPNVMAIDNPSKLDTSAVTDMSGMFQGCTSLASLDLSSFDTSNVENTSNMFDGCANLKSLDLSGWDTSKVTDATGMLDSLGGIELIVTQKAGLDDIALPTTMYEKDNYNSPAHTTMPSGPLSLVTIKATCGIYYKIDGNTLRLSGTEQDGYLGADPNAWQWANDTDVTKVVIEDDITPTTCGGLFSNLPNVTAIDNPNKLNVSAVTDMSHMFDGCTSLESLDLGGWDTGKVTKADGIFNGCGSLATIVSQRKGVDNIALPATMYEKDDPDSLAYTKMPSGGLTLTTSTPFTICYKIVDGELHLNSSGGDGWTEADPNAWQWRNNDSISKVVVDESMILPSANNMFEGLVGVTSFANLGYMDTSRVTDMSRMFQGCESLTSLDLSSFDTSNVTDMSHMFESCASATTINASTFDTSHVTDMSGMFDGCESLTSLDLSGWDTSHVTDMSGMFESCASMESLDASTWTTSKVTDMAAMFDGCTSLTSLDAKSWRTPNVTDMSRMFTGCASLTDIDGTSSWDTSKTSDMTDMFRDCANLKSLDLSSWSTPKVTDTSSLFDGCSSLQKLDITRFDTSNVTDMSQMFKGCKSLTSLDLRNLSTGKATTTSHMFEGCESMTAINMSSFDTSNVTDMSHMFHDCTSLVRLNPNLLDITSVTDMSHMFDGCESLTSLDLSNWDTSNVTDATGMLDNLVGIELIVTQRAGLDDIALPATMYERGNADSPAYTTMPSGAKTIIIYKPVEVAFESGYGIAPTLNGYRIFDAYISDDTTIGSHITWADDMEGVVVPVLQGYGYTGTTAGSAIAFIYDRMENAESPAARTEFINTLAKAIASSDSTKIEINDNVGIVPAQGFWLFNSDEGATIPIFTGVGTDDMTVELKTSTPEVSKEITNTGATDDGKAYMIHNLDPIHYKVTGTVSQYVNQFEKYSYSFNDLLDYTLSYDPDSIRVTVDGTDVTDKFTTSIEDPEMGEMHSLVVSCDDLKAACPTITGTSNVVLTYDAKVNSAAQVANLGTTGVSNVVTVTYSSNPLDGGQTTTTPPDKAQVHAMQIVLYKTDSGTDKPLAGAKFTVQNSGQYVQADGSLGDAAHEFTTDENGLIQVAGIVDGSYAFHESGAPENYVTCDDFTINITRADDGSVSGTVTRLLFSEDLGHGDWSDTTLLVSVGNKKILTMPRTGMAGIAILLVAGSAAIVIGTTRLMRKKGKDE